MLLVGSDLEATGGRDADLAYMRVADDIAARIASREWLLAHGCGQSAT